ncbi:MAG: hypothetical protein FWF50_05500 [Defluviitaleaceae bacterium]|nr:hypothetical protein [Defluviitaleaceae bacterium]
MTAINELQLKKILDQDVKFSQSFTLSMFIQKAKVDYKVNKDLKKALTDVNAFLAANHQKIHNADKELLKRL